MANEQFICDNWTTVLQGAGREPGDMGDTRTGTYCRNDAMSLQSYAGYIRVCALFKRRLLGVEGKQKVVSGPSYMYDLGFIPITMVPSYWPEDFGQMMYKAAVSARLPVYSRSPVGLSFYTFHNRKTSGQNEYWVSKMDVAERLGITPDKVTIEEVYRACGLSLQ